MNSSISNEYRYTLQGLPLYVAGFSRFFINYVVAGITLYVAGRKSEGDTYETLMRIIRESHETFRLRAPL